MYFISEYGTGKTLLLIHKATELLKAGEKVLFAIQEQKFLAAHLQRHFDRVLEQFGADKNLLTLTTFHNEERLRLIEQNVNRQHVFIDEASFSPEEERHLERLDESQMQKCLWIAFSQRDYKYANFVFKGERQLKRVFRNQPNIIRYLRLNSSGVGVDRNHPQVTTIIHPGRAYIHEIDLNFTVALFGKNL